MVSRVYRNIHFVYDSTNIQYARELHSFYHPEVNKLTYTRKHSDLEGSC